MGTSKAENIESVTRNTNYTHYSFSILQESKGSLSKIHKVMGCVVDVVRGDGDSSVALPNQHSVAAPFSKAHSKP